jgi:restriction system protein
MPTITEAILAVMREAGTPLSGKEAYRRILGKQIYQFHAEQPEHVVTGQIRRHCKDLDFPTAAPRKYFGMTKDGRFFPLPAPTEAKPGAPRPKPGPTAHKRTLASTLRELKHLQSLHRDLTKERLLKDLKKISPETFEKFARRLLEVYGFEHTRITAISHDGGIDGHGNLRVGLAHMRVAFQCKRWTQSNVGRREIDEFRGAIQGEYEQGIFFTTAHFAKGAKAVSIKPGAVPIILIDGPSIVELMIQKNFGVEQETLPVYTYALDLILSNDEQSEKAQRSPGPTSRGTAFSRF